MSGDATSLAGVWRGRNAAAAGLLLAEEEMRRAVRDATVADLVALIGSFSPGLARGPEWSRTLDPLVERLWAWRDDATMAALAAEFQARGPAWMAVANAFAPERGAALREGLRHPAWARLPAFGMA